MKEKSKFGTLPFHEAIESGSSKLVDLLIKAGQDVDAKDSSGCPAYILALNHKQENILQHLVDAGANVSTTTRAGSSGLYVSALLGLSKSVELLIQKNADVNGTTKSNISPLHVAAYGNHVESVKILLKAGAKVNATTLDGDTPLHFAAENLGAAESVTLLLEHGANINAMNSMSMTGLYISVMCNSPSIVQLLIERGADSSIPTIQGDTALDFALKHGFSEIVEMLLLHGAMSDISTTPKHGQRALEHVYRLIGAAQARIYKELDKSTSETLDSADWADESQYILNSVLLAAAQFGSEKLVLALLKRGASYRSRTANHRSLLHMAGFRGSASMIEAFLARGASMHMRDIAGSEPLDLTVAGGLGNLEAVENLIRRGGLAEPIDGSDSNSLDSHESQPTNDSKAALLEPERILEGRWSGHYVYHHWNKNRKQKTVLNLKFIPSDTKTPLLFQGDGAGEEPGMDDFQIRGQLIHGSIVRFVKLYKDSGWLYSGRLDVTSKTMTGSWGTNSMKWHGKFVLAKEEGTARTT